MPLPLSEVLCYLVYKITGAAYPGLALDPGRDHDLDPDPCLCPHLLHTHPMMAKTTQQYEAPPTSRRQRENKIVQLVLVWIIVITHKNEGYVCIYTYE